MKIKKYETEQFAGIRDKEVNFADGMNVILGDNEAGKSTVIAGIYHTLFQPSDPKKSSSEYKIFEELYKPAGTELSEGLYVDGRVELTLGDEVVKVEKSWLSDPDTRVKIAGTAYKSKGAEKKLAELLKYGSVFYSNIVFGRQSNEETVLQWIFDAAALDGKTEIRHKLDELGSVIGGIDTGKLKAALEEKMAALDGRWDFDLNAPARDRGRAKEINDPWKNGVGEILTAYYEWKRGEQSMEGISRKIKEIQRLDEQLQASELEQKNIKEQLEFIGQNKGNMQNKRANEELLSRVKTELETMYGVKANWPLLLEDKERVELLLEQEKEAEARSNRQQLESRIAEVTKLKLEMGQLSQINLEELSLDYEEAHTLTDAIRLHKGLLSSGKFTAHVKVMPGNEMEITDAESVHTVNREDTLELNGFVKIHVPHVGDVTVDTQGNDSEKIKKELQKEEDSLKKIMKKQQVQDVAMLLKKKQDGEVLEQKRRKLEQQIEFKLGKDTLEELENQADQIEVKESLELPENLEEQIATMEHNLGASSLEVARAVCQQKLETYKKEYTGLRELTEKIGKAEADKKEYEDRLARLPKLADMEDFEGQEAVLKQKQEDAAGDAKEWIRIKSALETEISHTDADTAQDQVDAAREVFDKSVEQHRIYACIYKDLQDIKNTVSTTPIDLLQEKIAEYLSFISGDRITMQGMDEKLEMELHSGDVPLLTQRILSQGTKKTILLAFKLAVLDFFFREEGGTIVLDDVLLDMDPGRRERSVVLLTRFAQNNQVIFTTCDPEMAKSLGGNLIQM